MSINTYNIELLLQKRISLTTNPEELLSLFKVAQYLKNNSVYTVNTIDDLPDVTGNQGKLYYVTSDKTICVVGQYGWTVLGEIDFLPGNRVWTWGNNRAYQLGDSTTINRSSPVTTIGGGTNWEQVAPSFYFAAAIKTDGTLWTWGTSTEGALGAGANTERSSPGTTAGGGTNWSQVSVGLTATGAIKTDGTLWMWGGNNKLLGTGDTLSRTSPVTTAGGGTNWKQISVNMNHASAIKTDGTLWTWGANWYGILGEGTQTSRLSPGTTAGGGTDWSQVSCGRYHTAAVKTDGTLWTWGNNSTGQLGDDTTIDRSSPGTTAGGGSNWKQVDLGNQHTTAIKTDGTLWAWGDNIYGTIGDGTTTNRSSPVTTASAGTDWLQVSAGANHSAAMKTNGTIWTWGNNIYGQLGDGTTNNQSSPTAVLGSSTRWSYIEAGYATTAGIQTL